MERGVMEITFDGDPRPNRWIELLDDGRTHTVHAGFGV
jgi:hypothetical protein